MIFFLYVPAGTDKRGVKENRLNRKKSYLFFSINNISFWKQRLSFLTDKIFGNKDKVFLLAISYDSDKNMDSVYVFDRWWCIRFLGEKNTLI